MQIQINSDKQIAVDAKLTSFIEEELERALSRFEARLTRAEVHLSDLNSSKPGQRDKRCLLEVRPAGQKPVSVTQEANTVQQALKGAVGKMRRLLETSFGRTATKSSRKSIRKSTPELDPVTARKLGRIETALSEILESESAATSSLQGHVKRASDAVKKARSLAATPPATNAPAAEKKLSPRGPKKKQVYRARRKSWPKR